MTATFHDPADAPADATESPELTAEDIAARRRYCTWLQYWRDCAAPACRRTHACAGDPTDCFIRHWMNLSDIGRVWVRAGIHAVEHGLTARNAAGAADLALLHHVKMADRLPRHPPRRRRDQPAALDGEQGLSHTASSPTTVPPSRNQEPPSHVRFRPRR